MWKKRYLQRGREPDSERELHRHHIYKLATQQKLKNPDVYSYAFELLIVNLKV